MIKTTVAIQVFNHADLDSFQWATYIEEIKKLIKEVYNFELHFFDGSKFYEFDQPLIWIVRDSKKKHKEFEAGLRIIQRYIKQPINFYNDVLFITSEQKE